MTNIKLKIVPAGALEEEMPKILQERGLQDNLTRKLCDSVEQLQRQIEAVDFWACAVRGLVAPIPDYQPDDAAIARYVKPGRPQRKRRRRVVRRGKEQSAKRASA
jgi:hypothetical protein